MRIIEPCEYVSDADEEMGQSLNISLNEEVHPYHQVDFNDIIISDNDPIITRYKYYNSLYTWFKNIATDITRTFHIS